MLGVVPAADLRLDSADALPLDRHLHPETQAGATPAARRNVSTVNPLILVFIVMIGVMFLMTRSARNKQRQTLEMRNKMEPGSGVRTIGGMYAVVKEVNEETVLLELTDGVHAHFAKNAIGTVLSEEEFNRIVHGIEPEEPEGIEDGFDDAAAADTVQADGQDEHVDLKKSEDAPEQDRSEPGTESATESKTGSRTDSSTDPSTESK
jgi:preprotein translocase subunit YajC